MEFRNFRRKEVRVEQMKKSKRIFLAAEAALACMFLAVVGLMLWGTNETEYKVSVILPDSDDGKWDAFKYGLEMAAADQGAELAVVSTEGMLDAKEETGLIREELVNSAEAMIICPVSGEELEQELKKTAKRVPVLQVTDLSGEDESSGPVIEPDHYEMGKELAQKILEDQGRNLRGKKIGILAKARDSRAMELRKQGVEDGLNGSGAAISWCQESPDPEHAESFFMEQVKVNIVAALDDSSLRTAGACAHSNDLRGALLYGIGQSTEAVYYLDTGYVECLVVPDDFQMGYQAMTEITKRRDSFFYQLKSHRIPHRSVRRQELFLKENQDMLFTMSQ